LTGIFTLIPTLSLKGEGAKSPLPSGERVRVRGQRGVKSAKALSLMRMDVTPPYQKGGDPGAYIKNS
jgi:hypothetical protein